MKKSYFLMCFSYICFSIANPSGCEVIHGKADLFTSSSLMQITATDRSILQWSDFSIGENEIVRFLLPSSSSTVLNRVTGIYPSALLGMLQSNGSVFLVNPNGIYVGEHAHIDVGSLVASTFSVLDQDFLKQEFSFYKETNGEITNIGTICSKTGDLILIANTITNRGSLKAPNGMAGILQGSEIMIFPEDSKQIHIKAHGDDLPKVINEGSIEALKIHIETVQNCYALAFRHEGTMNALTLETRGGEVFLCTHGGENHINGEIRGKTIQILGDHPVLGEKALVDASSSEGGGIILIGGDFQGQNSNIIHAKEATIASEALIKADALDKGDGGKVVIWSDGLTSFYGTISAQGGPAGGNGGIVEVSGQILDFQGFADRRAPNGEMGLLLLDPINITITNLAQTANVNNPAGPGTYTFNNCAPSPALISTTIGPNTLVNNLAAGNVTIDTNAAGTGACIDAGNIVFASPLAIGAGSGNLTVNASGNITINAAITNGSVGTSITMTAGGSISNGAAGTIHYSAAGSMGDLNLTASNGITIQGVIGTAPGLLTSGTTSLTDTSINGITILANIQNNTTGPVTIQENGTGPVTIGAVAAIASTSVGSRNGQTTLNAQNSTVTIQGGSNNITGQLGFFTPASEAASGNIVVDCNALNVTGGNGSLSSGQIGHGRAASTNNSATTAPANITVAATQNISVSGSSSAGATTDCFAIIGHGSAIFNSTGIGTYDQIGDITVTSDLGEIRVGNQAANTLRTVSKIGHGSRNFTVGGANLPNIRGNITVQALNPAQGDVVITTNPSTATRNNHAFIGPGGGLNFEANLIEGDILVECGRDLIMDATGAAALTNQRISIGYVHTRPTATITQNIRAVAGRDVFMGARQRTVIGSFIATTNLFTVQYTGDIEVIAGRNIDLRTLDNDVLIGFDKTTADALILDSNIYVGAGNNVTLDLSATPLISANAAIRSGGDVVVAAGNDVILTSHFIGSTTNIGTSNLNGLANNSTIIRAFRDIIATPQNGQAIMGYDGTVDFQASPYNVEIRAGGNIQMANSLAGTQSTQSGSIFIEADSCFNEGDLWAYNGAGDLVSISGVPFNPMLAPPIPNGPIQAPMNATSLEFLADGAGGFTTTSLLNFLTTSGDITVNSAQLTRVDFPNPPACVNLAIGNTAADDLDIDTTSGNIRLGGPSCRCPSGFNNIAINVTNLTWTAGDIYCRAANDLIVNTQIRTSAGSVTLISDCDDSAAANNCMNVSFGDVILNDNVIAVAGSIAISAGILNGQCNPDFPCTTSALQSSANVLQNAGTIDCDGNCTIAATGNIFVNNVNSTSGFIHMLSGDSMQITGTVQNITSAIGDILFVASNQISLISATIASLNPVTFVTDNANPSPPDFGNAAQSAFLMDPASTVSGSFIRIYTALQNLNTISGSLNSAAFPNPPGAIFQDYSLERWCTYYNCSNPFLAPSDPNSFTVYYKNCLPIIPPEEPLPPSEMLYSFNPTNEFIEWPEMDVQFWRFLVDYDPNEYIYSPQEPYWLQRRRLRFINLPNTYRAQLGFEARTQLK